MADPTRGMREADRSGVYVWPVNSQTFPEVQSITVSELLNFKRPKTPPALTLYISAARRPRERPDQLTLETS